MNKTIRTYTVLLLLLFLGAVVIEYSIPTPIDWSKTYNETHKIPYGTYVIYNELPNIFPSSEIKTIKTSPYEFFNPLIDETDSTYSVQGNFISIEDVSSIDPVSTEELLNFAAEGNTIFLASSKFPEVLEDSLRFEIKHDFDLKGKASFSFSNPSLQNDSITIDKGLSQFYFSKLDSSLTTVLGYQKFENSSQQINFIKVSWGKGHVYVHLQPIVFTNYNLLKKNNQKYASAALSYLPEATIYFNSKNKYSRTLGRSPLRFVLSQEQLRYAWYTALIAIVLFIMFNAKRKQRAIKIIKPLENTTIAFTKTIGNLYYETKDHTNLAHKKITYFLEHIRRNYYMDTQVLDDKFVKSLSSKTGKDKAIVEQTIQLIVALRAKKHCSEADLINLNKAIEDFYTQ